MNTIGIIQPNYLPWRGYFDFIKEVDTFVFLDDVQYTVRDWRNRNRILNNNGCPTWISVPVLGGRNQIIKDVKIDYSQNWVTKHTSMIAHSYRKTPYFDKYFGELSHVLEKDTEYLADLDISLTKLICGWLGISAKFVRSSDTPGRGKKDGRLLQIVKNLSGDVYLSGPSAQSYMRPEIWKEAGVDVRYKSYSGYPSYPQISDTFEPAVSIVDLIFMTGHDAADYIWGRHRSHS